MLRSGPLPISWRATVLAASLLTCGSAVEAQRRRAVADSVPRASIDSFVITVRDMAAWALVTPAAHVPVGAMQDERGNVESVVGAQNMKTLLTPDSVLVPFRQALGAGARARRAQAIGVAYIRSVLPPGATKEVGAVVVEVEHRSGYRATVLFPFDQSGEQPEFAAPFERPAVLQELGDAQTKSGGTRRQPRSNSRPR